MAAGEKDDPVPTFADLPLGERWEGRLSWVGVEGVAAHKMDNPFCSVLTEMKRPPIAREPVFREDESGAAGTRASPNLDVTTTAFMFHLYA